VVANRSVLHNNDKWLQTVKIDTKNGVVVIRREEIDDLADESSRIAVFTFQLTGLKTYVTEHGCPVNGWIEFD
jgi:hypothetical protein